MADKHALGMLAHRLKLRRQNARRAAGQNDLRRCNFIEQRKHLALEGHTLRTVFLHKAGALHRLLRGGTKTQAIKRCVWRKTQRCCSGPVPLHLLAQALLCTGRWIGRHNIESIR